MALLINGEYVGDEAFLAEFRRLGGLNIDPSSPAARQDAETVSRLAEQRVVSFVLLRQRAVAAGFKVMEAEVEARREQQWGTSSASVCGVGVLKSIGEGLLVEKYCNWLTRHERRPSRFEMEASYRAKREEFRTPEQARVMQVVRNIYLPEDEALARTAMELAEAELQSGVAFHEVSARYSDCGGKILLGWVKRGEMVDSFEETVFATAKGERSGIFRTVFGLHIVSVLEHKAAGYQAFEEIRADIGRLMLQARRESRIRAEVEVAMRSATIASMPVSAKSNQAKGASA
jgi:parvulin-like peptidyl-prolyl isomerase